MPATTMFSLGAALPAWLLLVGTASAYDPLELPSGQPPQPVDIDVVDDTRGRTVPIRVFLAPGNPAAPDRRPVVLFSHGLGGSRRGCGYLGQHWAQRGYAAVFLQHPGSDEAVWQDLPAGRRRAAMRDAASAANLRLRIGDVGAVLDALEAWAATPDHAFADRLDLDRAGMAGHSFGAQTAQAVGGQSLPVFGRRLTDPRIKSAAIMSPGTPQGRLDAGEAFAGVTIPWLLLTGTRDEAAIGPQTVESRLAVFPALPPGLAYELVLDGAEHSSFTDRGLPGDRGPRDPNHHRAILAVTTAFWDASLRGDAAAHEWLDRDGPRRVLAERDRWQRK